MTGKPRRVLHFLAHGFPGGAEKALFELLRAFVGDPDFQVGAAFWLGEGPYADKVRGLGVPLIDLRLGSGFNFRFDRQIMGQMREYDIHHFHNPSPNQILTSLAAGGKTLRVLTRRGGVIDYRREGIKKIVKYAILNILVRKACQGFSGNTANAADFVRDYHGVRDRPVRVLYNGLDFERLRPQREAADVRASLGLGEEHFVVATACHLISLKRTDLLIRAFAASGVEQKRLLLLGDGPEKGALGELARSLGVGDEVIFTGNVEGIGDYLQVPDCFVLASGREESFGNAVVEAMYVKVPSVIMADSTGLREHIIAGETGYVAADEKDLAAKLKEIHEKPEAARRVAERASQFVAERYSLARMKERYKTFYLEVLNVSTPSPS